MGVSPRVVIVGAGFGGLQCARRLARAPVEATLLDRHNYHLFTPLLYQVANAMLNPSDIARPVRSIFSRKGNTRFHLAEVTGIDLERQAAVTRTGLRFHYDYLVLAAGAVTNFFSIESVQRGAYTVQELPDALRFRNHVLRCFESADLEPDDAARRRWLTFVIVGAGPTGVEYAGALSELIELAVRDDYRSLRRDQFRIVLVEALGQVLPSFSASLGTNAQRELARRGVEIRLETRVRSLDNGRVILADGDEIGSATLAWTAGVKPNPLARAAGVELTASGRIRVDDRLRVVGNERVFAIGDIAAAVQGGRELPMMAPQAMQAGRYVARVIRNDVRGRETPPFRFIHKGVMATIGRNAGVAQLGPVSLKGRLGWLAYLVVHLYYLIGFRNRVAVFLQWAWDYLRYDRPIRIIARAKPDELEPDTS